MANILNKRREFLDEFNPNIELSHLEEVESSIRKQLKQMNYGISQMVKTLCCNIDRSNQSVFKDMSPLFPDYDKIKQKVEAIIQQT